MLKRLIQVALLSTTNINSFHLEQPKLANTQSFTVNLNYESRQYNDLLLQDYTDTQERQRSNNAVDTKASDVMLVKTQNTNNIKVTTYKDGQTPDMVTFSQSYSSITSTTLTKYQITPYKNTINTEQQIYQEIAVHMNSTGSVGSIKFATTTYVSQDPYWATYIDDASWAQANRNYSIIQDLIDANHGFIYTATTTTNTLTITNTQEYKPYIIESTITLNPNVTNYIYVYTELLSNTAQNFWAVPHNNWVVLPYHGSITGEYILANVNYEVIDVPNIMFEVLTMPFTFISVAFNLTLFPNTPYQINISNLFLTIIATLVFLLIIKKLTGK